MHRSAGYNCPLRPFEGKEAYEGVHMYCVCESCVVHVVCSVYVCILCMGSGCVGVSQMHFIFASLGYS